MYVERLWEKKARVRALLIEQRASFKTEIAPSRSITIRLFVTRSFLFSLRRYVVQTSFDAREFVDSLSLSLLTGKVIMLNQY